MNNSANEIRNSVEPQSSPTPKKGLARRPDQGLRQEVARSWREDEENELQHQAAQAADDEWYEMQDQDEQWIEGQL